jgi:hypothetical protein
VDPTENTPFKCSSTVVGVFTHPLSRNGSLLIRQLHGNGYTCYIIYLQILECPDMALGELNWYFEGATHRHP